MYALPYKLGVLAFIVIVSLHIKVIAYPNKKYCTYCAFKHIFVYDMSLIETFSALANFFKMATLAVRSSCSICDR